MKLKAILLAVLVATSVSAAPIAPPANKNPLDRPWLVVFKDEAAGIIVGTDQKSFKVVSPEDEFTFDMAMIFTKEGQAEPLPNGKAPSALVSTVKASCKRKQAQIITDTAHDASGQIIAKDEAAKLDTMGPISPNSSIGRIVASVCSRKSLTPNAKNSGKGDEQGEEKPYKRGDSLRSA